MKRFFSGIFKLAVFFAVLVGLAAMFGYHAPFTTQIDLAALTKYFPIKLAAPPPCVEPIKYGLGAFDARFNISRADFLSALSDAKAVWEKAIGKTLFTYASAGPLEINLVYDFRQQAQDRLKKLGGTINSSETSYNKLKAQYEQAMADYQLQKQELDTLRQGLDQRLAAYNAAVSDWNTKGGAPAEAYQQLELERRALNDLAANANHQNTAVNDLAGTINALAERLNELAVELNLKAATFNGIVAKTGSEFQEGEYVSDERGQRINVYEFSTRPQLVRVLAHELGHALGLQHVDDPNAIMFRLNQSKNEQPTVADLRELKALCGVHGR